MSRALPLLLLCISTTAYAQQTGAVERAVELLQQADFAGAEAVLRDELRARPGDAEALGVLGVTLDQEKKYDEAGQVYQRAVALTPRSPALLNNYGNHLMAAGRTREARGVFQKVLALNPAHPNANTQMARLALQDKDGTAALRYLAHVGAEKILRMEALYLLGRKQEGDALLREIGEISQLEPRVSFSVGTALSGAGQYVKAEGYFARALEGSPAGFDVLYGLGLAAAHAGHNERAREVLMRALEQQPGNVDLLYDLAAVNAALGRDDTATELLATALRLAPSPRPEVEKLLAHTTANLGFYADAIRSWDRYLELVPGDEEGRRERAWTRLMAGGGDAEIGELRAYVRAHPDDAVGHYELGVAEGASDPADALLQLDRSLALKPDFTAARFARGFLRYRQGSTAQALGDFEFAAARDPENPTFLDRLGQTYAALGKRAEAVRVLRKAAELAPGNTRILMRFSRALSEAGEEAEASTVMARVRELGPNREERAPAGGLVEFLSLPRGEQLERYRDGVTRAAQREPANAEAQVRYLELLLGSGKVDQAAAVVRQIARLRPKPELLEAAADALLAAGQYAAAMDLLGPESGWGSPSPVLQLDLAIATLHARNAQAGIAELDKIPEAQRNGDYFFARAEMLRAMGSRAESEAALARALRQGSQHAELYHRAVADLLAGNRFEEAVQAAQSGTRRFPGSGAMALTEAIALQLAGRTADAVRLLREMESRWPELGEVWLADAIVSNSRGQTTEAQKLLGVAAALRVRIPAGFQPGGEGNRCGRAAAAGHPHETA